ISFAPLKVGGGPFQVVVAGTSTTDTVMKLYWWQPGESPSENQTIPLNLTPYPKTLRFGHLLRPGRPLYLRLDPAETKCIVRFQGYLTGPHVDVVKESRAA